MAGENLMDRMGQMGLALMVDDDDKVTLKRKATGATLPLVFKFPFMRKFQFQPDTLICWHCPSPIHIHSNHSFCDRMRNISAQ
jgi:hypothetical protein